MKRIWNSFKIAFSMYSKIPMQKSEWTKENMRYVMCFFPWVGIVAGGLTYGWYILLSCLTNRGIMIAEPFQTVIYLLIPVFLTGGIHLDGLLDTADALSSYQEKERRLEILKDPHAGAFAIITCVVYFLFLYGVYSMIDEENILVISLGFILSRSLSGLSVVTFPLAKGTGLAAIFSDGAQKRTVRIWMCVYILLAGTAMLAAGGMTGAATLVTAGIVFFYYYRMSKKNFGGITGDLCGWFLQICEAAMALIAVAGFNPN